jgi:hypothetical protein
MHASWVIWSMARHHSAHLLWLHDQRSSHGRVWAARSKPSTEYSIECSTSLGPAGSSTTSSCRCYNIIAQTCPSCSTVGPFPRLHPLSCISVVLCLIWCSRWARDEAGLDEDAHDQVCARKAWRHAGQCASTASSHYLILFFIAFSPGLGHVHH